MRGKKAQSTVEYVFMAGAVIMAFAMMTAYMHRGIQDRIRMAADELGTQEGSQDNANYGTLGGSTMRTISHSDSAKQVFAGGSETTTFKSDSQASGVTTYIKEEDE